MVTLFYFSLFMDARKNSIVPGINVSLCGAFIMPSLEWNISLCRVSFFHIVKALQNETFTMIESNLFNNEFYRFLKKTKDLWDNKLFSSI